MRYVDWLGCGMFTTPPHRKSAGVLAAWRAGQMQQDVLRRPSTRRTTAIPRNRTAKGSPKARSYCRSSSRPATRTSSASTGKVVRDPAGKRGEGAARRPKASGLDARRRHQAYRPGGIRYEDRKTG